MSKALVSAWFVCAIAGAQPVDGLASLLQQFRDTQDAPAKEHLLLEIEKRGEAAGAPLLAIAQSTADNDTRWLAIRGLGAVHFREAAPYLIESLRSNEHYVRANAARALGELRYTDAAPALMELLTAEQDSGAIEQTSLALRMLDAKAAVPTLKTRLPVRNGQTRCWLLDAIAQLGGRTDAASVAPYLYADDGLGTAQQLCAATALSKLTGQDFGLPTHPGLFDPVTPVMKARAWWQSQPPKQ